MDADTVNAVNTHEKILERFQRERFAGAFGYPNGGQGAEPGAGDPGGVLDADMSLYVDSYRAAETTFNMLTQVVGRAGRGQRPGRALIQTMTPEHRVIVLASQQDYGGFYELEGRSAGGQGLSSLPGFIHHYLFGPEEGQVLGGRLCFGTAFWAAWKQTHTGAWPARFWGLQPAAVAKINYHYRYRLTPEPPRSREVHRLLAYLLRQFAQDRANRGISAFADINGYD